jgi:hypothetical protein
MLFFKFFEKNLDLVNVTMSQPEIKELWAPGSAKVNLLVTMPLGGNEIGFFVAHKLNATFVLW